VIGHHYDEMSIILLPNSNNDDNSNGDGDGDDDNTNNNDNGRFTINSGCEVGDVTLRSENENDIIEVKESSWLSETEDIVGVFSIRNTSSVRFFKIIFNLPSSSLNELKNKAFIDHSSSGILILESVRIGCIEEKNKNILKNENWILMTELSESLIRINDGDGKIERCEFSNIKLKNGNGSVLNSIIKEGRSLNISKCEFKNCIIKIETNKENDKNEISTSFYGGAIYIEIEKGGNLRIEGKYDYNDNSDNNNNNKNDGYTFIECHIESDNGYGGGIGIYLKDGVTDLELIFSGIKYFFFF
jgi:hypothetical protein